jgi:FkbM family methyltransferase
MIKSLEVMRFVWTHPANRHRRMRAVARACYWQLSKRLTGNPWTIRCYDVMQMRCYPNSNGAGLMIYTNGMIDYDDVQFTQAYLRPGDAFLDVGANIGVFTLLAAACVGKQGFVRAYEPGRSAFEHLLENVQLNQLNQVELHCVALAEQPGQVSFLQTRDLTNRIVLSGEADDNGAESTTCITLDMAVADRRFEMGKMDVEGAEPLIFRRSQGALSEGNPPVWVLELKDRLLIKYGSSAEQFARFLQDYDYQLGSYDADRGQLDFLARPWQGRDNVIAVHASARDEVQRRLTESKSSGVQA